MVSVVWHHIIGLALTIPRLPWPWFTTRVRLDDPTCYRVDNTTWVCAPDALLHHDVDPNDSY